jgi:TRAP-type C4-dicarboxylate transport system permease small subunit
LKRFLTGFAGFLNALTTFALWGAVIALIALTLIVGAQVIFRYGLGSSLIWSEPMAVLLMGWFIFLGSAVGTREGFHLSFDLLGSLVPARMGQVLESVSDLVVLIFGAAMAVYGFQLAAASWGSKMPALGIPDGFGYVPVILGGAMVALFSLERIARRFAGLPIASTSVGARHVSEV